MPRGHLGILSTGDKIEPRRPHGDTCVLSVLSRRALGDFSTTEFGSRAAPRPTRARSAGKDFVLSGGSVTGMLPSLGQSGSRVVTGGWTHLNLYEASPPLTGSSPLRDTQRGHSA